MKKLILLAFVFLLPRMALAANWFVDNTVSSSGNGQSWATAWKDFNNIVWASVAAGDTIYISGGTSTQTYSSQLLTVGKSGGAGNPITITSGDGTAGHTGTAIIDGTTSMSFGVGGAIVDNNGFTNLVIQNLIIQNTYENCIRLHGISSGTIVAQNLTIHTGNGYVTRATNATTAAGSAVLHFASLPSGVTGNNFSVEDATTAAAIPQQSFANSSTSTSVTLNTNVVSPGVGNGDIIQFAFNARGARIDTNSGGTITFQNNTIDTPASTLAQTDGVFTSGNTGASGSVIVQNNTLIVNNIDPDGHNDAIQSFQDKNITFRNNIVSVPNGGISNVHAANLTDVIAAGTVEFYNNLVFMGPLAVSAGTSNDAGIAMLLQQITTGFSGTLAVYNNTIVGGNPGIDFFWNFTQQTYLVKNNIIYSQPDNIAPYALSSGNLGTPANVAQNLVYTTNGGNLRVSSTAATTGAVRATSSFSSGLKYYEFQLGYIYSGGNSLIGMANGSQGLTDWVGHTTNGVGYWWSTGQVFINNTAVGTAQAALPGDVVGIAIDLTHSKIWVRNLSGNGLWNNAAIGSQDPANNVGGFSLSTLAAGPYFAATSITGNGSYGVLNMGGGSGFLGTPPTGFSSPGTSQTWNPSDISSPATLTPPIAILSGNTSETWSAWQALGYDANGVNSDPLLRVPASINSSANFDVLPTSPSINAGATIGTVGTDYRGVTRPQGSAYDIGAFDHASKGSGAMMGVTP